MLIISRNIKHFLGRNYHQIVINDTLLLNFEYAQAKFSTILFAIDVNADADSLWGQA